VRPLSTLARIGSCASLALAVHAEVNLKLLRRAPVVADVTNRPLPRVAVLLPVRDEAPRVGPCLEALLTALRRYGPAAELLILDDESSDGTYELVRALVADSARTRLFRGTPLPPGWLGKPHACHQLAASAQPDTDVLVFIDADVVLEPDALIRTVAQLQHSGLDLVSPYPRQHADTPAERLIQPLLQWSWATLLPLRVAERSDRRSMTAANGQLLAVRADAYHRSGGHAAKPHAILDDIALLKSLKDKGFHGVVTDGTDLATCRMYESWPALRDGYSKSLWAATGSPSAAAALCAALIAVYVLPPLAWFRRPRDVVLAAGTFAAVANRALVANRVGGRVWPDSLSHPFAVLAFTGLTARSWIGHRAGSLRWKSRAL
jgi:glycosyltransferase involved in cell wall biosynthesis